MSHPVSRPGNSARQCAGKRARLFLGTALALGASAVLPTPVLAEDVVWDGSDSTNWFAPANWTPATVPDDGDDLHIDTGAINSAIVSVAGAGSHNIFIGGANGRLTINNSGTLATTGDATIGDAGGTGEALVIGANASWSVAGSLELGTMAGLGSGRLTISQGGTVTVGDGTGTVSVGVNGGTGSLFIGGDPCCGPGILKAANVNLGSAGLLRFTHNSTAYDFAPVISGNGSVSVNSGITRLTGDSSGFTGTTTIGGGGTLHIGNADFSGFGIGGETGNLGGTIVNNGVLVLNRGNDFIFDAIISGNGSLLHNLPNPFSLNTGETTLTGVHSYTGLTTINNGRLYVTGSIASSSGVTVNGGSGTWLGGTGTLPNTLLASGSLVPGLGRFSIGTLTIAGNLSFTNGSYLAETTPTTSDFVNITGTANLAGRLALFGTGDTYSPGTYTLLTAAGGLNGTFSIFDMIGNFGGLYASLTYAPNSIVLNLAPFTAVDERRWLAAPATDLFTTAGNWVGGAVPIGTARFGPSSQTTLVLAPGVVQLGQMVFDADAPAYTFNIDSAGSRNRSLHFLGAGIVNNSAVRPNFFVLKADLNDGTGSTLHFLNNSSAGNAHISNLAYLPTPLAPNVLEYATNFWGHSTAANALIENQGYGTAFHDNSTAANATFFNQLNGLGGSTAFYGNSTAANAAFDNSFESGGVGFLDQSSAGSAEIFNRSNSSFAGGTAVPGTFTTGVYFAHQATAANAHITNETGGNTSFWGSSTADNATIVNSGAGPATGFFSLIFAQTSTAGSATITNNQDGVTSFQDGASAANATIVNNAGGTTYLFSNATGANATITNNSGGTLLIGQHATAQDTVIVNNAGGLLDISSEAFNSTPTVRLDQFSGAGDIELGSRTLILGGLGGDLTLAGTIANGGYFEGEGGGINKIGTGKLTLTGSNSYTGTTTIDAGTLQLGNGGGTGSLLGDILNNAAFVIDRTGTLALGGTISGSGSFTQNGTVTTTLGGTNTYSGPTTINGGTLLVNGSIANSDVTVNAGATLGGNGTVGSTTIGNGGVLAPGQLEVDGDLVFGEGSNFRVNVASEVADRVDISGTASLAGTVTAVATGDGYTPGQYTLLSAAGGIIGTFGQVTTQGSFNGLIADLEYTTSDVLLTLAALGLGDAMWSATPDTVTFGNRSDYHTPSNWTGGTVPTATAVFGATAGANIFFENPVGSPPITIGRFQFNPDAPAYTFTLTSDDLTFTGEGVTNSSGQVQTLISGNRSTLRFANSSSPGNAHLIAEGSGGVISFEDTSTADVSLITIGAVGFGQLQFRDNASGGNATIENPEGSILFFDTSTGGNAAITNQNLLTFRDNSSLGNATITNNALVRMFMNSTGPGGTIVNNQGAVVDISADAADIPAASVSIGSLSGAGDVRLGGRNLTLGALNHNDLISGAISDGGDAGGTGGSVTKIGTGTLSLSGANTYTGGTTVNGGTLLLTGSITGAGPTTIGSGTGVNGQLTIQAGGAMSSNGAADIGAFGGIGNVLVTGAGSFWAVDGGIALGQPQLAVDTPGSRGFGRLTIQDGATVSSNGASIQRINDADGAATVTGAGSVWNTGALGIQSSTGTTALTIQNGGKVDSGAVSLAGGALVTGAGSLWNTGHLTVGPNLNANGNPAGRLEITAGAVVNSTSAELAEGGSFTSQVSIGGPGSAWNVGSDLVVGDNAFHGGSVSVLNGGALTVGGGSGTIGVGPNGGLSFFTIGGGAPGTLPGTVNAASMLVGSGSFLSFDHVATDYLWSLPVSGSGQILVGNGMTIFTGDSSGFAGTTRIFNPGVLQIGNGGNTGALGGNIVNDSQLIVNRSGALTLGGIISGTGSLTQYGTVATILSAANTYTGETRVNGGTLFVTGSIASSSLTSVFSGARLGGTGTVGDVGVNSFGTLAPGTSIGTLATGNLTLTPGSTLEIELNDAGQSDLLIVTGTVTLGAASILDVIELGTFNGSDPFEYLIIDNDGSDPVSGTFGAIYNQFAFLTPSVIYDAGDGNDVLLRLTPNNSTGVDARWLLNPGGSEWNTAANWDPVLVPTGTATFGPTNTTLVQVTAPSTIGRILFEADAPSYHIAVGGSANHALTINGAGVVNNSSVPQTLSIAGRGTVTFTNSSTAANLTISAGNNQGLLRFLDMSSAGSSTITLGGVGFAGGVEFFGSSTAGNATIHIEPSTTASPVAFHDNSTAGAAAITNDAGLLLFVDASSLGTATIANNATMRITENANGPNAIVANNTGGTLDISAEPGGAAGVSVGTLTGAGDVSLGNRRLTLGGSDTSGTIGGVIADGGLFGGTGGGLTKIGTGTLTLSGANTYTGATTVNGGTLLVTGSIGTSAVTVNGGATLGGTGTVGSTTISSGGTLSPGASIGTLNVAGNLAFSAGSNFTVEVGPAAADRVNVTGSANLAGTLTAVGLGGTFSAGTEYTLLNAGGGITGTFNQLVTQGSLGGLAPTLSYNANNVILTLGRSGPANTATTTFTDALVFNAPTIEVQQVSQFETRIIGRLAGGTPLFDQTYNAAFGSATVDAGVAAARLAITSTGAPGLILVSDPVLTSRTVTSTTASNSVFTLAGSSDTVTTITTFGPATVTIGDATSCGATIAALPGGTRPACGSPGGTEFTVDPGTVNINTLTHTDYFIDEARTDTVTETTRETYELTGTVVTVGTIHAEVQSGLFDLGGGFLRRLSAPRRANSGWADGYGFRVRQGGRRDALGVAAGVNLGLAPGVTLAVGLDHANLDIEVPGALEAGDVGLTGGGAALRIESGGFSAALAGSYGEGNAATLRTIAGSSAARYDVRVAGAALDVGYGFDAGGWTVRPVAGLDYVSVHSDGFTESDTLGLVAPGQQAHRWRGTAGLEVGRRWDNFELAASARYLTVLSGDERTLPVAFALAPARVLAMTAPSEPDAALIGLRAGIDLSPHATLSFGYEGRFGGGYTGHSGLTSLTIGW